VSTASCADSTVKSFLAPATMSVTWRTGDQV